MSHLHWFNLQDSPEFLTLKRELFSKSRIRRLFPAEHLTRHYYAKAAQKISRYLKYELNLFGFGSMTVQGF